ncbi:MAG TPA: hypothetical protein VEY30_04925, partial [Myxococcaceae bacterium]|nr:hypothetical protein [Myxococcaceae bacterium]
MPERRLTARRAPRDAVGVYVFPKGERGQLRGGGREREETSATPITGVTPVLRRRALVPEDASEARAVYDEDEPTVTAAGSEPEEATELAADPRKPFRPRRTRTPAERKRLEIHELLAARDPVSALQGLSP